MFAGFFDEYTQIPRALEGKLRAIYHKVKRIPGGPSVEPSGTLRQSWSM